MWIGSKIFKISSLYTHFEKKGTFRMDTKLYLYIHEVTYILLINIIDVVRKNIVDHVNINR